MGDGKFVKGENCRMVGRQEAEGKERVPEPDARILQMEDIRGEGAKNGGKFGVGAKEEVRFALHRTGSNLHILFPNGFR